ncbi:hypothetical protein [Orlajensenia leifsoniae]|uniref:DUF4760 domain-containing protein n=1 Tax=Orlajensenia leifsoniae TaxID=2561933 RepID=A0A4Y9QTL0_9MICO|nr:hypothetical protein [Leifsonia flava]TFV95410.1 hypothetical protein E4M00_15305 [Leifsonia flava]
MNNPNWTDVVIAFTGIVTPVLVAVFGVFLARRQSRSQLLQQTRFEYYKSLAPDLNRLMCYLTFIGTWRDDSPPEIVALKRRLDSTFHVAAPLFSGEVSAAYRRQMDLSFATFGNWGQDATIRSSAYRRQQTWSRADLPWEPGWQAMFDLDNADSITAESLAAYRKAYDDLLFALVTDLSLTRAREEYTTPRVSRNASPSIVRDIPGTARP